MSVHYKFKSALESDTVSFDGLHISVRDLKNSIMQQKRIGKNNDFDLQVTNAETKEVYDNDDFLIPKNTSLLIARVPSLQAKPKVWEGYGDSSSPLPKVDDLGAIGKAMDLSSLDASEEDKIKAMMSQSTQDYDPSNYLKIRGANQVGTVPPNYRCYKCHQGGHWIKDCTLNQGTETMEIKKSTGIPRSFMVTVEGPQVQGAMITPNGSFAVPALDHQAYTEKSHPAPPPEEAKTEIPEDLVCSLCSDLLTDAVMIPCCGDSYCDECIRSCLLESEDHECPACHEKDISPGTLIPNRFLRNSVGNFKNTTGYVKRPIYKPSMMPMSLEPSNHQVLSEPVPELKQTELVVEPSLKSDVTEFTDTNEVTNEVLPNSNKDNVLMEPVPKEELESEEPRRISPIGEHSSNPVHTIIRNVNISKRSQKNNSNERSPRRRYHKTSPTYHHKFERGGTPTIDEPGMPPTTSVDPIMPYQSAPVYSAGPPPPNMGMMAIPPPTMQAPQPPFGGIPAYPPPNPGGIPPNFRLPPPVGAPPYVPGGYNPRPMYDVGRMPQYPPGYPPGNRNSKNRDYHRDYPPRRGRSPLNTIIDDPLEAFNRMLREKDERDRRAKQRKGRSYSRSISRSLSPTPPPRKIRGSRSPRRRSRSFSLSRSRSRSFSPVPRLSPHMRNFSPKRPYRKMHSRYPSPDRSPPRYRFKDDDRDHRGDRGRDNHSFHRGGDRERDFREPRDRDFKYYDGYDRNRGKGRPQWNGPRNPPEQFYQPPDMAVQQPYVQPNRYPSHDAYQPHIQQLTPHQPPPQSQIIPPIKAYEDVLDTQPPIPGLEDCTTNEDSFLYKAPKRDLPQIKAEEDIASKADSVYDQNRYDKMGGTPERKYYSPPPRKQDREHDYQGTPDKHHKRRKHDDGADRRKDASDDERSNKKSKEKKKKKEKKEKKEEERKKRRERREKREQEKLNKKAMEEKERNDRKHKRDIAKHNVETQASNDEDEENAEADVYDSKNEKYLAHENMEVKRPVLEADEHYNNTGQDYQATEHDERMEQHKGDSGEKHTLLKSPSQAKNSQNREDTDNGLYGDLLTEEIDKNVIQNYGRVKNTDNGLNQSKAEIKLTSREERDEGEITDDESEKDVLDIHINESELKMEVKGEVLAPLPERSKWELDEDAALSAAAMALIRGESKLDKSDKLGKVTNEVLKRAENAIFAKAINAIRPIEIKKISLDRAKLYSGERDKDKSGDELRDEARNIQITITGGNTYENEHVAVDPEKSPPKVRLSVKERLGCKVDELDRIVKIDKPYERNRSHSLSPLSRRSDLMSRNLGQGERRFELDSRSRQNHRLNFRDRNRDFHRQFRNDNRHDVRNSLRNRRDVRQDRDRRRDDSRKDDKKSSSKVDTLNDKRSNDKRKNSRSKSSSEEKNKTKKKDKKDKKKEKVKRNKKDIVETETNKQVLKNDEGKSVKMTSTTEKRKPTLDEANFEPDYDLESESEKEDVNKKEKTEKPKTVGTKSSEVDSKQLKSDHKKPTSSSSESTESSSEDDRKRRKNRKNRKKKNKKDSVSNSSSGSESETSDENRDKHRKRHKKKLKKRKRSKHK